MKKILSLFAAVLFAGSMMAANLYEIDFTQGQGGWTIDNKINPDNLEAIWTASNQYGMVATGFTKNPNTNHETEAWLVSPAIDLSEAETVTFSISQALNFATPDFVSILATADNGENWTALELSEWPVGSNWTFVDATADMSAFAGQSNVIIAFRYTSTADKAGTWEIKSVAVSNEAVAPVEEADVTFTAADFAGQGTSSTGSEVLVEKEGITISSNKGFGHDAALRVYKGGSFSIVSAEEQIGKIVFTFGAYQGEAKDGGLAKEVVVNAQEFVVESMASAAWFEKIQIYFGEYEPIEPGELVTITVAEAMAIGEAIEGSGKTDEKYSVIGYVINAKPYGDKYEGAQTFYMSDDRNAAKGEFTAFNCNVAAPGVEAGDYVIVTGRIQKYVYEGGDYVIEITGGDVLYAAEGVENVVLTEKANKVMIDGVLYIVRGNKMFDVRGTQVR